MGRVNFSFLFSCLFFSIFSFSIYFIFSVFHFLFSFFKDLSIVMRFGRLECHLKNGKSKFFFFSFLLFFFLFFFSSFLFSFLLFFSFFLPCSFGSIFSSNRSMNLSIDSEPRFLFYFILIYFNLLLISFFFIYFLILFL